MPTDFQPRYESHSEDSEGSSSDYHATTATDEEDNFRVFFGTEKLDDANTATKGRIIAAVAAILAVSIGIVAFAAASKGSKTLRSDDLQHDWVNDWRPHCMQFDQLYNQIPGIPSSNAEDPFHISARTADDRTLCLESNAYGNIVSWYKCDEVAPNQQWFFAGGMIRSRWHPKCLSHFDGTLSLTPCTGGEPSSGIAGLFWIYDGLARQLATSSAGLVGSETLCVDVEGGLKLRPCSSSVRSQALDLTGFREKNLVAQEALKYPSAPMHVKNSVVNAANGVSYCLSYEATTLRLEPCSPCAPNQQWLQVPDTNQLMTYWHHRCLAKGTPDSPPQLGECKTSDKRQRWNFQPDAATEGLTFSGLCQPPTSNWTEVFLGKKENLQDLEAGCRHGIRDTWSAVRLANWPKQGADQIAQILPSFSVPQAEVPPALSEEAKNCSNATEGVDCGSEVIQALPGNDTKFLLDYLRYEVWKASTTHKLVVHIGDERGLLFRAGNKYRGSSIPLASEMKPMSTVVAMRLVELGVMNLDDKVSKWLNFWPTDPSDSRSYITLRHCLAFTTGFYGLGQSVARDGFPAELSAQQDSTVAWMQTDCDNHGEIECARIILNSVNHIATPGTVWTYTGDHLRLAAAVMTAATRQTFGELLEQHVFNRTSPPMRSTRHSADTASWSPASTASSTPQDFQRFMDAYFKGQLISSRSMQEMEADSQPYTTARYYEGETHEGRPDGQGVYGLGWWRSHSNKTLCGQFGWCAFAPNHFGAMAAVERVQPEPPASCDWKYSKSCSFYFHIQNADMIVTDEAKAKIQGLGHTIEKYMYQILSGHQLMNVTAMGKVPKRFVDDWQTMI